MFPMIMWMVYTVCATPEILITKEIFPSAESARVAAMQTPSECESMIYAVQPIMDSSVIPVTGEVK